MYHPHQLLVDGKLFDFIMALFVKEHWITQQYVRQYVKPWNMKYVV